MYPGSHAADRGAQAAVIWAPTGAVTTFAELDAAANRLSRLLRSLGVAPGDHVALCMENHPRYVEVLWGCHYAGTVYTAASSRLTSGELAYVVDDCGATVFITTRHLAEQAADIVATTPSVRARLMLDGTIAGYDSYEDGVDAQDSAPLEARVAGTDMLYSSGTTGRPKGVSVELGSGPLETHPEQRHPAAAAAVRVHRRRRLPVAGAALPRRRIALHDERQRPRRHGRRHGSLRR